MKWNDGCPWVGYEIIFSECILGYANGVNYTGLQKSQTFSLHLHLLELQQQQQAKNGHGREKQNKIIIKRKVENIKSCAYSPCHSHINKPRSGLELDILKGTHFKNVKERYQDLFRAKEYIGTILGH